MFPPLDIHLWLTLPLYDPHLTLNTVLWYPPPPLVNSDHLRIHICLSLRLSTSQMTSAQPSSRTVWRYISHANFTLAEQLICATDWDELIDDDIDTSWGNWQSTLLDIMEKCIPKKVVSPKRRNLPWLNKGIVQAMCRQNAMFKWAKRSGNEQDYAKYCWIRNEIVKDLRSSRRAYFQGLKPSNHKKFWKPVK